jgi:hypothetical protein
MLLVQNSHTCQQNPFLLGTHPSPSLWIDPPSRCSGHSNTGRSNDCSILRPASKSFCQSGIIAGRPSATFPGAPSVRAAVGAGQQGRGEGRQYINKSVMLARVLSALSRASFKQGTAACTAFKGMGFKLMSMLVTSTACSELKSLLLSPRGLLLEFGLIVPLADCRTRHLQQS